jgi:hypothetical protein
MNKEIHRLALQAWNEKASYNAEPEQWMAAYIERVAELIIEECKTVLITDLTCIDEHGHIAGKVLQQGAEILDKHFGKNNETTN